MDLEDRSRRCNVRIIGLIETPDEKNLAGTIQSIIFENFGKEHFSALFLIERAHRIPGGKLIPGRPPKTVIIKMLAACNRDMILRSARNAPPMFYNGCKLYFFPDFSKEVQDKRRTFLDVKKRLQGKDIKYSFLYPAKLRVVFNETLFLTECPLRGCD